MGAMGGGAGGGGAGGGGAGGGGAGGGGAGGGGAGGGGAGGGGAGGGGAGGAGSGHAGGPTSTLMNAALATTHDAIVGYWQGDATNRRPLKPLPVGYDTLEYLSAERRTEMLGAELCGRFKVEKVADKTALVTFDGNPVYTTKTPPRSLFKKQLVWLRNYADLRFDRIPEINIQTGDLLSFFGLAERLDVGERKSTLELLTAVQRVAYAVELQVKHICWAPRPLDYSSSVQPIIQTPDHSTYPSGHATESFAIAKMLVGLAGNPISFQEMPYRIAHRISVNRTIAGVHFPVDSAAGAVLGHQIAAAILAAISGGSLTSANFDANSKDTGFTEDSDFLLSEFPLRQENGQNPNDAGIVLEAYKTAIKAEWEEKTP